MKKMPCLFKREGEPYRAVDEQVIDITGATATVKWDGTATMVVVRKQMVGKLCVSVADLYMRYALKPGKKMPRGFIHVDTRPDSGKMLGWIPADRTNPAHKWYFDAAHPEEEGTYELCGPKFQSNPHKFTKHYFIKHGADILYGVPTDFDGLRKFLAEYRRATGLHIEGIVWWRGGEPIAKIKRSDYGLEWNVNPPRNKK